MLPAPLFYHSLQGDVQRIEEQQPELQCSPVPITSCQGRTFIVTRDAGMLEWQSPTSPAGICDHQVRFISPGLGAVCNGIRTGGLWSQLEQQLHIKCLELLAATLAVKLFHKDQEDHQFYYSWTIRHLWLTLTTWGNSVAPVDSSSQSLVVMGSFQGHCPVCRTYPRDNELHCRHEVQNFDRSNRLKATPSDI